MRKPDIKTDTAAARKQFQLFKTVIRRHPTDEWIGLVSRFDSLNDGAMKSLFDSNPQIAVKVQPFQRTAIIDFAIRLSNNHRGNPLDESEYYNAAHLYLDSDWRVLELIQEAGVFYGMTFMGYEQSLDNKTLPHLLGRTKSLYSKFAKDVERLVGIPFDRVVEIGLLLFSWKNSTTNAYFTKDIILRNYTSLIDEIELDRFLEHSSKDYRSYREVASTEAGIEYSSRYGFRFLRRYPIIEAHPGKYAIPQKGLLFHLVTEGMYYLAMEGRRHSDESVDSFHSEFGDALENYVRWLISELGFEFSECSDVVTSGPLAEFYTTNTTNPVVVEVKKISYRRDTPYSGDPRLVKEDVLKLREAFGQVENTFNYVPNAIGLIVTYGQIPFADGSEVRDMLKSHGIDSSIEAPPTIVVITLDELEHLIAGGPDEICVILQEYLKKEGLDRGSMHNVQGGMVPSVSWENPILTEAGKGLLTRFQEILPSE
jgi:hypothetical protein